MTSSGPVRRPSVLYLVYWGAAEPLGQSLVLPAVKRLSALGAKITLATFEKPADLARSAEMTRIRDELAQAGVGWHPLRYHKRPKWPATLWDAVAAIRAAARLRRLAPIDIVHARTFVGGVMGSAVARRVGARLVFHNEGFYPDEQVDGGFWRFGSVPHRLARALEARLYDRADGLIVLSHRAREVVEARPGVRERETPVIVVPSCVDLRLFELPADRPPSSLSEGLLRLVYVGSIGGRYRFDQVGPFAVAARRIVGRVHVRVLTPTEPARVAQVLTGGGLRPEEFSVARVPHSQMSAELSGHDAGLFLFTQGLSEHACSPTKIGEYWATGLPVVTTPNVSDVDGIIREERVGVIVPEFGERAYEVTVRNLLALVSDPQLPAHCRQAAVAHYALEPACERQIGLYRALTRPVG